MRESPADLLQRHLLLSEAAVDERLSKADVAVLAVLLSHVNKRDEHARPGITRITEKAQLCRRSVIRAVQSLSVHGYIDVERRIGRPSLYWPSLPGTRDTEVTSDRNVTSTPSDTSAPPAPVTNVSPTRDTGVTPPVTSVSPHPCHPCHPNSALELSSLNSEKRTQVASPVSSNSRKQEELTPEQDALRTRIARDQYRIALETGTGESLAMIEKNHRERIADMIPEWRKPKAERQGAKA